MFAYFRLGKTNWHKSESLKRIEGEVKHHDFKDNPDLPDWYRRRGFSVVMGDEKTSWVAKISLAIWMNHFKSFLAAVNFFAAIGTTNVNCFSIWAASVARPSIRVPSATLSRGSCSLSNALNSSCSFLRRLFGNRTPWGVNATPVTIFSGLLQSSDACEFSNHTVKQSSELR